MKIPGYRNSKKIHILLIVSLLIFIASPVFSVSAIVQEISGKVELKAPGDSWQAAEQGMEVTGGTTVSTGFNSKAVIRIGESILEVEALTRMDLEELIEREGTIDTKLHLKVGKVKADVRSTEGLRNNFRLRSPVSTAAVRGTVFEYDGYALWVEQGTVVLGNNLGQQRAVTGGEQSSTDGYTQPAGGEDGLETDFVVNTSTSGEGGIVQIDNVSSDYALVVLNIQWD
jgi:hypothetical protein